MRFHGCVVSGTLGLAAIGLSLAASATVGAGAAMALPHGGAQVHASLVQEQPSPSVESQLAELAPERHRAVLAELGRLGPHPWAGIYRTTARWPKVLAIAPEAGY